MAHVQVTELPPTVRAALKEVKYFKKDIEMIPSQTYIQRAPSGKGQKGFTLALNIATGQILKHEGSWGGENPFVRNPIDSDDTTRSLPEGFIVIQGTQGYPRTYAVIYINPNNLVALLPPKDELSDRENALLAVIKQHTSAGRKDFWKRYPKSKPRQEELDSLVSRGFLKRNKAGAISISTKGKNAISVDSCVWYCEGKEKYD